jgi:lambda repressor-like predicted transcriptional regulator
MVKQVCNREILDQWIAKNKPHGLRQLAKKAKVGTRTIASCRAGKVPKSPLIQQALSEAVGVTAKELFPSVETLMKKAS